MSNTTFVTPRLRSPGHTPPISHGHPLYTTHDGTRDSSQSFGSLYRSCLRRMFVSRLTLCFSLLCLKTWWIHFIFADVSFVMCKCSFNCSPSVVGNLLPSPTTLPYPTSLLPILLVHLLCPSRDLPGRCRCTTWSLPRNWVEVSTVAA